MGEYCFFSLRGPLDESILALLLEMREKIVACARVSVRSSAVYNSLRSRKRVCGLKLKVYDALSY